MTNARSRRSCSRGGWACAGVARDERADAASGFDDAGAFELGVDARDGVGVDAQVDGELADGRQLVAGLQPAGGDRRAQPALELRVNRRRVARVDRDDVHLSDCTSTLVQCQERLRPERGAIAASESERVGPREH